MAAAALRHRFHFHHTSIRVKDPLVSVDFYQKNFGMKLVHIYHFNESKFSLYFLQSVRHEDSKKTFPTPNTPESEKYLFGMKDSSVLELTHNHGSECDDGFRANNGNVEPYRGFGHTAFNTPDVVQAVKLLQANGVKFQKLPTEGTMKTIAFALDPDGYWIELVGRGGASSTITSQLLPPATSADMYNYSQTMIRVKDPVKSIAFYRDVLGMTLIRVHHFSDFSLYFFASLPKDVLNLVPNPYAAAEEDDGDSSHEPLGLPQDLPASLRKNSPPECAEFMKTLWRPVLELTHNHGTERKEGFCYHDGNKEPQGFGHTAFTCDDVQGVVDHITEKHPEIRFKKRPEEGKMRNVAFLLDPDGYLVELLPEDFSKDKSSCC
eukprot:GHVS01019397.1.p1 GENE.GHVS01019397.1~~GHVS01019397.1.p1  ORF type:complete len:378 (-),score=67.46 GHVS01019397.1:356-1489(-)